MCSGNPVRAARSIARPSLQAAYRAEPELAEIHLDLKSYLNQAVTATLLGVLPRH
jgi:hypothetical protein